MMIMIVVGATNFVEKEMMPTEGLVNQLEEMTGELHEGMSGVTGVTLGQEVAGLSQGWSTVILTEEGNATVQLVGMMHLQPLTRG